MLAEQKAIFLEWHQHATSRVVHDPSAYMASMGGPSVSDRK